MDKQQVVLFVSIFLFMFVAVLGAQFFSQGGSKSSGASSGKRLTAPAGKERKNAKPLRSTGSPGNAADGGAAQGGSEGGGQGQMSQSAAEPTKAEQLAEEAVRGLSAEDAIDRLEEKLDKWAVEHRDEPDAEYTFRYAEVLELVDILGEAIGLRFIGHELKLVEQRVAQAELAYRQTRNPRAAVRALGLVKGLAVARNGDKKRARA